MGDIKTIPFSYTSHLQEVYYKKNDIDQQNVRLLLSKFQQMGDTPFGFIPTFYIIDYTKQEYVLMSEGVGSTVSYSPQDFIDGGIDLLIHIFDKDDFRIFNEKIFTANRAFLQSIPPDEHKDYQFNYTFRVKDGCGGSSQVYQRCNYITDDEGQPLYSLGMVMNISGLFNERIRFHSIEKSGGPFEQRGIIQQNYFYPYHEDTLLTKQEKNIAGLIADGFSTKQIADKLHITSDTISTHRKNMMRKTNTKNVAELVAFTIRNHII